MTFYIDNPEWPEWGFNNPLGKYACENAPENQGYLYYDVKESL